MSARTTTARRGRLGSSTHVRRRLSLGALLASGALTAILVGSAGAANPASATTTTNQQLTVGVTLSTTNDPVWLGTPVNASAQATLGEGDTANVVYVVDVSGSMENTAFNPLQPSVGDCDGDGLVGTALDAACVGLIALNDSLGSAVNVNVGLVAFGDGGKTADMGPAGGTQTFTSPPDNDDSGNTVPDAEDVIHSLATEFGGSGALGGVGLFTPDITAGFPGSTNYDAALTNMNASFATQSPTDINTGFFISDGLPNTFTTGAGSPLQDAVDAGTRILTFGIGGGAANSCDPGAPLRTIADATGGTCTEVADPSMLSTVLPAQLTNIEKLELEVNGTLVATANGPEPVSLALSNVAITSLLVVGINTIEATATAEDDTVVTASTTLGVIDLALTPATETNDLSLEHSHTVVAKVSGDPSQVGGIPIAFAVTGQNGGTAGTCNPVGCMTAANGEVSFTYSVPVAPTSIGPDTITAVATIPAGTATRSVTKTWADLTPPSAACQPTTNPSGNNIPPAGNNPSSGQNPDGFYVLLATDAVDPNPQITVSDTGSSFVAGPYSSGTKIKLTQAPGAKPNVKKGPGVIDWHITLKGDAVVTATDGSGNSVSVSCKVPPPPK
jgi:hypothetical protein